MILRFKNPANNLRNSPMDMFKVKKPLHNVPFSEAIFVSD